MNYSESRYRIFSISFLIMALALSCASDPVVSIDNTGSANTPAPVLVDANSNKSNAASLNKNDSDAATATTTVPVADNVEDFDNADQFVNGKKLSIPKVTGSVPPRDDSYHDTDNNAIVVLQSPTEAMARFPRDRRKEVDWVKTLDAGIIEPRADLKGKSEMVTMDMDIVMKNTQFMPWVKFPHLAHTKWLACENCHPKIFIPQEHANPISMNKVLRGEFCGVCHDKVSFSLFICERCHSVPHEGSGPAWWKAEN